MHLSMAHEMVQSERLIGRYATFLTNHFPAFYFGSIAPDSQNITQGRIKRFDTHFYHLPPYLEERGDDVLTYHPALADASAQSADYVAFLTGYIAHLQIDLVWNRRILQPYFIFNEAWGDIERKDRFLRHNLLLTLLDQKSLSCLPKEANQTLSGCEPQQWLPFVPDTDLINWRDNISNQLLPDAPSRTVAIFAERLGLSPEAFETRLLDEVWLHNELFAFVQLADVEAILAEAVLYAIDLITDFLAPRLDLIL